MFCLLGSEISIYVTCNSLAQDTDLIISLIYSIAYFYQYGLMNIYYFSITQYYSQACMCACLVALVVSDSLRPYEL